MCLRLQVFLEDIFEQMVSFMERALELARGALGTTSPNPAVGAVIAREGLVVGEGATQPPGGPHAEIVALAQAGALAQGSTLYVTLEPCCHFGRTPPCTDAILAAGIVEVHVATVDPSPWVNGSGIRQLKAGGVRVVLGELEVEARRLNEAYFKWVLSGLPFVTAKYAMTLDGKTATTTGSSRWISGPEARRCVMAMRARCDAILVGVGTVIADDPQLTARDEDGFPLAHQPLRVVLDSRGRMPLEARVAETAIARTVVVTTDACPGAVREALSSRGIDVLVVPAKNGRVDPEQALRVLATKGVTSVLVESGGTLLGSLIESRLVDKLVVFVAPKIVGGKDAPGPVGGSGVETMDGALPLRDVRWELVGQDMMVTGYLGAEEAGAIMAEGRQTAQSGGRSEAGG